MYINRVEVYEPRIGTIGMGLTKPGWEIETWREWAKKQLKENPHRIVWGKDREDKTIIKAYRTPKGRLTWKDGD